MRRSTETERLLVTFAATRLDEVCELPDGRLLYRLKRRRNGTTEVALRESDFYR